LLVKDGGIIHRDVSINNIMIANKPRENELKGFLIDLDMAKAIGSESSGATNRTGTMEFMAINILKRREPHSYRDDLESFFYVLIWICVMYESTGNRHYIQDAENKKRSPPVLDGWSSPYAASVKCAQMTEELEFQDVLNEFSDGFRELESMMKEIRQALFPSQDGGVTVGSEVEQDRLYGAFLGIIQRQLNKMSKWGQSPYLDWWRGVKVGRH
jgi:serine/threonine protein kinase